MLRSLPRSTVTTSLLLGGLLAPATPAHAQRVEWVPFAEIGSETAERNRLASLFDSTARDGVLLRSLSRFTPRGADTTELTPRLILPQLRAQYASALPWSANDGPLRAGRGMNVVLSGGIELRTDRVRLIVAPQLVYEQNLPFQVIPFPQDTGTTRTIWANPFHTGTESIDLPFRFGDRPQVRLDPGQTSLTVRTGSVELGAGTENLWWGPGIRNALVLSDNAAGFPHFLARSVAPIGTRTGVWSFDAILGTLSESGYFDSNPSNDSRSIAGAAVTWRRARDSGIEIGAARLRIAGSEGHDQMSSLFGRWVFAPAGFEAYVEWARFEDPESLRDLLESPTHSQGYTYGLQWARQLAARRTFRLQAEVTYVEPDASLRVRPVRTSYTSLAVPQGFTQRGEVLGAAIGPGSSGQYLSADWFGRTWRVGAFAGRTRYDNAGLFAPQVPPLRGPDVTVYGGARLASDVRGTHLTLELTDMARLNYLYQAGYVAPEAEGGFRGIDISNRTVSLIVTPALRF